MERKGSARMRLVSLRAVGKDGKDGKDTKDGPAQEIIGIALGYRMVYSEQAEVWTVSGILQDGNATRDDIGELSFVLIPGEMEPATAVTGFIAPSSPYVMAIPEEALRQQLRGLLTQLGYDLDGFYASFGIGGRHLYYEDYRKQGR